MKLPVSVVIPAYNEEDSISDIIYEIKTIFKQAKIETFEVIVVNDGSTDRTVEKLKNMDVIVISHPHNIGYGRSLKDGIIAAQYDTIVITDADCTYPFKKVPDLLAAYQDGFDMVVGARTGKYYQESLLKSPLRRILRFIVEFSAERKIPDINSGLRVFSKSKLMPMLSKLCDTFSFTTSMSLAFMMTGKFVKYIDIPYHKRNGRTKVRLFRDSFRTLQYILQAINYYNPLKLFILFAGFCLILSFFFFFFGIFTHWKTLFSFGIGSALLSLVILCVGLLADSLKQLIINKYE
ncbi:MAG TPA: glycosyltransferase family 2 protein [Gammaproteobacteria bacterium]|nr:glycosyltransferase family 2 protein [Gammaproteobacteria bacterium]